MHPLAWTRTLLLPALAALPLLAPSPGSAEDYSSVPWKWRYGNWGGKGYSNGEEGGNVRGSVTPVDALDAIFKTHDQDYAKADRDEGDPYVAAFRKALAKLLKSVGKPLVVDRQWWRAAAQGDKSAKAAWKKWKVAYEKADDKAKDAARKLTPHPSGRDPQTGAKEEGTPWSLFLGRVLLSESQRKTKRSQFLAFVESFSILFDPPRTQREDEVMDELFASRR